METDPIFLNQSKDYESKIVSKARNLYCEWINALCDNNKFEKIAKYYGVSSGISKHSVDFKSLFFASRFEPVLNFINFYNAKFDKRPRILDLGCGYGLESSLMSMFGANVTALDSTNDKILKAQELVNSLPANFCESHKNINFIVSNIFKYKPEYSFDAIISAATLHHIEPIFDLVRVFPRILSKDGYFFLIEENGLNPLYQLYIQNKIGWFSKRKEFRIDSETGMLYIWGRENIRPAFIWRNYFRKLVLSKNF